MIKAKKVLEGIDYYPNQKKSKKLIIILFFVVALLVFLVWAYIPSIGIELKPKSTSIVISKPKVDEQAVENVVDEEKAISVEQQSYNNSENLDTVIQTYEANSQD